MNISDLKYKESNKARKIWYIFGWSVFAILTLVFMFTDFDIWIVDHFHDPIEGFFLSDEQPWKFLYDQQGGIIITLSAIAIIMIIISWTSNKNKEIGRYGWFIIAVGAIGTGLVVNGIFKGYWGRPRPRESLPFGTGIFYRLWYPAFIDLIGEAADPRGILSNSSFSAGHPTEFIAYIALFFVFFHPEFFVKFLGEFKEWKLTLVKILKYLSISASLIGGFLMGAGRAIQGGHWPSDSLWSFGFVYIIAIILYYKVFNFPLWEKERFKKWQDPEYKMKKNSPIWATFGIMLCVLGLIATPIWIIEFVIRPDVFLPELISSIVILIFSPIFIIKARKAIKQVNNA